jgi:hypothetical protein
MMILGVSRVTRAMKILGGVSVPVNNVLKGGLIVRISIMIKQ